MKLRPNSSSFKSLCLRLIVLCLLLTSVACTKKETPAQPSALLSRIPREATGYFTMDTTTDAYASFSKSPWASEVSLFSGDNSSMLAMGSAPEFAPFVNIASKLLKQTSGPDRPLGNAIVFFRLDISPTDSKPMLEAGSVFEKKSGSSLATILKSVRTDLEGAKMEVRDETVDGRNGFSLKIPDSNSGMASSGRLFFVADDKTFAAGTTADVVSTLLKNAAADSKGPAINETPYFQKTMESLGKRSNELFFGYVDVARVLDRVAQFSPDKTIKQGESPAQGLGFSRTFNGTPQDRFALSVEGKNDQQKGWIKLVENSSAAELGSSTPSGAVFHLQLDGGTIKNVMKAVTEQGGMPPMPPDIQGQIDSIKRIGITLKNSDGASLFPGLLISAQSNQAPALKDWVKGMVAMLGAAQGLPVGGWQEKTIEETPVSFMLTPLGVGVYLSATPNFFIAASSEEALQNTLSASKDSSKSLPSSLPGNFKEMMQDSNSVGLTFIDFAAAAKLIESSSGTLSMFTGGQPPLEPDKVASIRKMGTMMYVLKAEPGAFTVSSLVKESTPG